MIDPSTMGAGILQGALQATGQRVSLGEVTWAVAAGETEESPTVVGRQDGVAALVEERAADRVQEALGADLEGSHHAVLPADATVTTETVLKVTAGNFAGEYFRVQGVPAKPLGHHWELGLEPVDPGDRVRADDVLA